MRLEPATHSVKLVRQYSHGVTVESRYMGNVQSLPNGDAMVGWGDVPFVSEFSRSGKLIYDAVFPTPDITYRAYVQHWVGLPLTPPSGAARRGSDSTTVYASWNGATRVTRWKVLAIVPGKPPRVVAEKSKSGFETEIAAGGDHSRFELQALDSTGQVIGTSRQFGIS